MSKNRDNNKALAATIRDMGGNPTGEVWAKAKKAAGADLDLARVKRSKAVKAAIAATPKAAPKKAKKGKKAGVLAEVIRNYEPKAKTAEFVREDGEVVACTPKQAAHWAKLRDANKARAKVVAAPVAQDLDDLLALANELVARCDELLNA